jgi:hypothetical protein
MGIQISQVKSDWGHCANVEIGISLVQSLPGVAVRSRKMCKLLHRPQTGIVKPSLKVYKV